MMGKKKKAKKAKQSKASTWVEMQQQIAQQIDDILLRGDKSLPTKSIQDMGITFTPKAFEIKIPDRRK